MEQKRDNTIYGLLPGYFKNELSIEDKKKVEDWKAESDVNSEEFQRTKKVWDLTGILNQMEEFDTPRALGQFKKNIKPSRKISVNTLQRFAAILLLPLIAYTGFLTYSQYFKNKTEQVVWQQFEAIPGAISNFTLPDGSTVCLNMASKLEFPSNFGEKYREVKLSGEAFFEVKHNAEHPFLVNTGKVNVEVLGTKFNVSNYNDSETMQVVLESGKVALYSGEYSEEKKELGKLFPGERVVYSKLENTLKVEKVEIDNYTSWQKGILIFKETPMQETVNRLSRWFNTDIELVDEELKEHFFTATFVDESLTQVLELLKHSSTPINYEIVNNRTLKNGSYTKEKIRIFRKK